MIKFTKVYYKNFGYELYFASGEGYIRENGSYIFKTIYKNKKVEVILETGQQYYYIDNMPAANCPMPNYTIKDVLIDNQKVSLDIYDAYVEAGRRTPAEGYLRDFDLYEEIQNLTSSCNIETNPKHYLFNIEILTNTEKERTLERLTYDELISISKEFKITDIFLMIEFNQIHYENYGFDLHFTGCNYDRDYIRENGRYIFQSYYKRNNIEVTLETGQEFYRQSSDNPIPEYQVKEIFLNYKKIELSTIYSTYIESGVREAPVDYIGDFELYMAIQNLTNYCLIESQPQKYLFNIEILNSDGIVCNSLTAVNYNTILENIRSDQDVRVF